MSLRSWIARIPGTVEAYKLLKNVRYRARTGLGTEGNLEQLGLAGDAARAYVREIFSKIDEVVADAGGWAGKRVLELGPGDTLGAGMLAIAHGAELYTAIDRFPVRVDYGAERTLRDELTRTLSPDASARLNEHVVVTERGYESPTSKLRYHNALAIEDAASNFGTNAFDVIFSNAVLEHVHDVKSSFDAMRSLLAPGGVMLHDVDLRSHQRFESHELQFLQYPDWLWKAMTSHTGEPNRMRLSGYVAILKSGGFRDIRVDVTTRFPEELVARVRHHLDPSFRTLSLEDLGVATFRVRARAPESGPSTP